MKYWWVNQNQTYRAEVLGGFLWSPKTNKNGSNNHFYDNMPLVQKGDLIFSFCDTKIKAVGVALETAKTAAKPNFGRAGANWKRQGWLVPVEFTELRKEVRPKYFIRKLRPHLPEKYAPLQFNGNGNQAAYLVAIPSGFANVLLGNIGKPALFFTQPTSGGNDDQKDSADHADQAQKAIEGRTDIGPTQKKQLIKARRGQGIFKSNVRFNEDKCRFTGVSNSRLLIASHIKPWAESSDKEKLDGCNGLLLSPHIDCLFDSGLISFKNDGKVLISSKLDRKVLQKWGIEKVKKVGRFNPQQCVYLRYHRSRKFKKSYDSAKWTGRSLLKHRRSKQIGNTPRERPCQ